MVTDILFPFYEILVETIFGNVFLAIIGLGIILSLILFLCRTSWMFVTFWIGFYFIVMFTMYIGALGLVLGFIITFLYFIIALLRFVAGTWVNI